MRDAFLLTAETVGEYNQVGTNVTVGEAFTSPTRHEHQDGQAGA
jgi:hypothetical protein